MTDFRSDSLRPYTVGRAGRGGRWAVAVALACGLWLLPNGAGAEEAKPKSGDTPTQSEQQKSDHQHSCPGMAGKHAEHGDHAMKDGQCCKGKEGGDSCKAKPEKQSDAGAAVILAQAAGAPDSAAKKPEEGDAEPAMDHSKMDHSKMDHSKMDHSKMDHSGHGGHHHHKMVLDAEGMVMNWNDDTPTRDCKKISGDVAFEVRAGRKYAVQGQSFGFSQNEWNVPACSRVTITFVNEDSIRHQWMLHGLPRYLYDQGMFHLEAAGGTTRKGTFIVPSSDMTYLVHCDMAQHMEKGLKGQLKVGKGSGDLPSVPGFTDARVHDPEHQPTGTWQLALLASGMLIGVGAGVGGGWIGRKSKKSK